MNRDDVILALAKNVNPTGELVAPGDEQERIIKRRAVAACVVAVADAIVAEAKRTEPPPFTEADALGGVGARPARWFQGDAATRTAKLELHVLRFTAAVGALLGAIATSKTIDILSDPEVARRLTALREVATEKS